MNPLDYSAREQAKAIAAGLSALAAALVAGTDWRVALISAAGVFYATFAVENK